MLVSALLAAAVWPIEVTKDCEADAKAIIVGVAKNDSGEIIYCEIFNRTDEKSLKVSYLAKGKLFAEKNLTFLINPFIPSVTQKDFRAGELRQADVSEKNVELHYQANSNKKISSTIIPLQKIDILDAGFNNFVRAKWDELESGNTLSVNFASMPHLKTLPLRISVQQPEKCLIQYDEKSPKVCFLVEIDNALLRMILGNIKVTYDQNHRLYEFNGLVNIEDDKQNNQKAIIRYFYQEDYLSQAK